MGEANALRGAFGGGALSGTRDDPGPATRRAARNAVFLAGAEIAGKVATLAFTVAAARALGPDGFGLFAYALSFSLLVAALPSWGFDSLLVQRGSGDRSRLPAHLGETLIWRSAIAVPTFAGAAIAGLVTGDTAQAQLSLLLVLAATFVDIFADTGRAAAGVLQEHAGVSIALVIQRISAAILGIAALWLGFGLVGLATAYLVAALVGAAGVALALVRRELRPDFGPITRAGLLATGRLSIPIGINAVAAMALFRIDQVMIAELAGDAAVGAYAAAYRLVETVLFVSWAVARAVFPVMSAATEDWRVRRGIEQGIAALAVLYVPFAVGLWFEAPEILGLLYGRAYAETAASSARWLAAAPLLFAGVYLLGYGLLALRKAWTVAGIAVGTTLANVVANLVLIPRLEGTGAAMATVGSYSLEALVLFFVARSSLGRIRLLAGIAVPVGAAATMGVVLAFLDAPVVVEVAVGVGVYLAAWLALARRRAPEQVAVMAVLLPTWGTGARLRALRVPPALRTAAVAVLAFVGGLGLSMLGHVVHPLAMVAVPVALLGAAAVLMRPVLGIVGVFASFPVAFRSIPTGLVELQIVEAVALLAVGLIALRRIALGVAPLAWDASMIFALLFLVGTLVATPGSVDVAAAMKQEALLVGGFLLALAVPAACGSLRALAPVVTALLLVGAGISLHALRGTSAIRASFGGSLVENRAQGVFGQPNELGAFAATVLVLAAGATLAARTRAVRILGLVTMASAFAALLLSLSRGAWLGAALGVAVLLVLAPAARRAAVAAAIPAGVILALVAAAWSSAPQVAAVQERLATASDPGNNPYDERPAIWREAWREIREEPWTGHGPGNFPAASTRASSAARSVHALHAHNLLLTVAAEVGIPTTALLLAFVAALGLAISRAARVLRDPKDRVLAAGIGAALAVQLGQGLVDFPLRNPLLFMLVWSLVGMALVASRQLRLTGAAR